MDVIAVEEDPRSDNFKKIYRYEITSANNFETPTVSKLYQWWDGFKPNLPAREDFDITHHWTIASSLYLIETVSPGEYLHRLNGENVVDIIGVSLRGHDISVNSPLPELRRFASYMDRLVEGKKPGHCKGTVEIPGVREAHFETIDCPLLRQDGTVGFILGAISLVD